MRMYGDLPDPHIEPDQRGQCGQPGHNVGQRGCCCPRHVGPWDLAGLRQNVGQRPANPAVVHAHDQLRPEPPGHPAAQLAVQGPAAPAGKPHDVAAVEQRYQLGTHLPWWRRVPTAGGADCAVVVQRQAREAGRGNRAQPGAEREGIHAERGLRRDAAELARDSDCGQVCAGPSATASVGVHLSM